MFDDTSKNLSADIFIVYWSSYSPSLGATLDLNLNQFKHLLDLEYGEYKHVIVS